MPLFQGRHKLPGKGLSSRNSSPISISSPQDRKEGDSYSTEEGGFEDEENTTEDTSMITDADNTGTNVSETGSIKREEPNSGAVSTTPEPQAGA